MAKVTVIPPSETQKETLRVAAYCRVSSDSADQKHSYAAQIRAYTDLIGSHPGWELVDIYADEARTGTRADIREDFQRLLADCRKGKIDKVLVKSISRFARNTRDCLAALRELFALGVSVEFEEDHIDTGTLTTELMVSVSGALAQQESVSISQNQRMSYQRRMQRGEFITCCAPYGYRLVDGKHLEIEPREAAIIRWIFECYLEGRSTDWIAAELSRRNIETPRGEANWGRTTIQRMLANEKYIGDSLCQKAYTTDILPFLRRPNCGEADQYYVEQTHPAILSRETYQRAQELHRRKSRRAQPANIIYPLSKKMICGQCGARFSRRTAKHTAVWVCRTHQKQADACPVGRIPEAEIYAAFVRMYNKLRTNATTLFKPALEQLEALDSAVHRDNPAMLAVNREIADTAEQSYKLQHLQAAGLLDMETCAAKHSALGGRLAQLREQRRRLLQNEELDELILPIRKTIDAIHDGPERLECFKETLFAELVDHIIVESQTSIRFHLRGGIELREQIREVRR